MLVGLRVACYEVACPPIIRSAILTRNLFWTRHLAQEDAICVVRLDTGKRAA